MNIPETKVIFKADVQIGDTGKVFKKCQVYDICGITSKNYTVKYDAVFKSKIPKEWESRVYYAFVDDRREKSLRERILREENAVLTTPTPLTQVDNDGIMEPEENTGEVEQVEEKVKCPHCETEFERTLLEEKDSLDKCLVCGEFFEDFITCPECSTKIKHKVLDKQKDKGICPVCGDRLDGKKVKVSSGWKLAYSSRDIERFNEITLVCQKCNSIPSVSINKFEALTPEQCKLKDGETIRCEEPGCKNVLTADFIVLAEEKVIPETFTVTCPTCGSHDVKKIKLGSKIMAAGLLDVLSVGYISKTFECQNCKYTW